jgi:flagellar biosynthetic protein FliO
MQQMLAVALVLALLGGSLWWLRRRGVAGVALTRCGADRRLECLQRLPIGPQQALLLVRMGETELLVSSSPSGCRLIEKVSRREVR